MDKVSWRNKLKFGGEVLFCAFLKVETSNLYYSGLFRVNFFTLQKLAMYSYVSAIKMCAINKIILWF